MSTSTSITTTTTTVTAKTPPWRSSSGGGGAWDVFHTKFQCWPVTAPGPGDSYRLRLLVMLNGYPRLTTRSDDGENDEAIWQSFLAWHVASEHKEINVPLLCQFDAFVGIATITLAYLTRLVNGTAPAIAHSLIWVPRVLNAALYPIPMSVVDADAGSRLLGIWTSKTGDSQYARFTMATGSDDNDVAVVPLANSLASTDDTTVAMFTSRTNTAEVDLTGATRNQSPVLVKHALTSTAKLIEVTEHDDAKEISFPATDIEVVAETAAAGLVPLSVIDSWYPTTHTLVVRFAQPAPAAVIHVHLRFGKTVHVVLDRGTRQRAQSAQIEFGNILICTFYGSEVSAARRLSTSKTGTDLVEKKKEEKETIGVCEPKEAVLMLRGQTTDIERPPATLAAAEATTTVATQGCPICKQAVALLSPSSSSSSTTQTFKAFIHGPCHVLDRGSDHVFAHRGDTCDAFSPEEMALVDVFTWDPWQTTSPGGQLTRVPFSRRQGEGGLSDVITIQSATTAATAASPPNYMLLYAVEGHAADAIPVMLAAYANDVIRHGIIMSPAHDTIHVFRSAVSNALHTRHTNIFKAGATEWIIDVSATLSARDSYLLALKICDAAFQTVSHEGGGGTLFAVRANLTADPKDPLLYTLTHISNQYLLKPVADEIVVSGYESSSSRIVAGQVRRRPPLTTTTPASTFQLSMPYAYRFDAKTSAAWIDAKSSAKARGGGFEIAATSGGGTHVLLEADGAAAFVPVGDADNKSAPKLYSHSIQIAGSTLCVLRRSKCAASFCAQLKRALCVANGVGGGPGKPTPLSATSTIPDLYLEKKEVEDDDVRWMAQTERAPSIQDVTLFYNCAYAIPPVDEHVQQQQQPVGATAYRTGREASVLREAFSSPAGCVLELDHIPVSGSDKDSGRLQDLLIPWRKHDQFGYVFLPGRTSFAVNGHNRRASQVFVLGAHDLQLHMRATLVLPPREFFDGRQDTSSISNQVFYIYYNDNTASKHLVPLMHTLPELKLPAETRKILTASNSPFAIVYVPSTFGASPSRQPDWLRTARMSFFDTQAAQWNALCGGDEDALAGLAFNAAMQYHQLREPELVTMRPTTECGVFECVADPHAQDMERTKQVAAVLGVSSSETVWHRLLSIDAPTKGVHLFEFFRAGARLTLVVNTNGAQNPSYKSEIYRHQMLKSMPWVGTPPVVTTELIEFPPLVATAVVTGEQRRSFTPPPFERSYVAPLAELILRQLNGERGQHFIACVDTCVSPLATGLLRVQDYYAVRLRFNERIVYPISCVTRSSVCSDLKSTPAAIASAVFQDADIVDAKHFGGGAGKPSTVLGSARAIHKWDAGAATSTTISIDDLSAHLNTCVLRDGRLDVLKQQEIEIQELYIAAHTAEQDKYSRQGARMYGQILSLPPSTLSARDVILKHAITTTTASAVSLPPLKAVDNNDYAELIAQLSLSSALGDAPIIIPLRAIDIESKQTTIGVLTAARVSPLDLVDLAAPVRTLAYRHAITADMRSFELNALVLNTRVDVHQARRLFYPESISATLKQALKQSKTLLAQAACIQYDWYGGGRIYITESFKPMHIAYARHAYLSPPPQPQPTTDLPPPLFTDKSRTRVELATPFNFATVDDVSGPGPAVVLAQILSRARNL